MAGGTGQGEIVGDVGRGDAGGEGVDDDELVDAGGDLDGVGAEVGEHDSGGGDALAVDFRDVGAVGAGEGGGFFWDADGLDVCRASVLTSENGGQ